MSENGIKVLCVAEYYLPGYKGGGPVRTIKNMCDAMFPNVDLWIFTRDHDLGSDSPYTDIQTNHWNRLCNTHVFYADRNSFNAAGLIKATEAHSFGVIYLNSFFSYKASISVYLRWRFGRMRDARLLIAPRGEFSTGALALKFFKKRAFLYASRLLGLYRDVHWHASTKHEAEDILRVFPGVASRIHLATDPVTIGDFSSPKIDEDIKDKERELQLIFISRISPKKNLDGLLKILREVKIKAKLSIFGPIEDEIYWQQCQSAISTAPKNILIEYGGLLEPNEVSKTFAKCDLFVFPTHGENFGHVIFESLRAGTPVLVSDQTPWQRQPNGVITVLPLGAKDAWVAAIESAGNRNADERRQTRTATVEYARRYMTETDSRSANLKMFREVASLSS